MAAHRVAEHPVADLHRQRRGVQRDDLARAGAPPRARSSPAGPPTGHSAAGRRPGRTTPARPGEGPVAGNRRVRAELLPDVLADQVTLARMVTFDRCRVSSRTAKIASRTSSVMLGCPPLSPQPPAVHAAGQPVPAPGVLPPDQGPLADRVRPSIPASSGPSAFSSATLARRRPQRRGRRVVGRPRLARPGPQRVPAAEPGLGLQQVRDPQLGQLPLPGFRSPGTLGWRPRSAPRRRSATTASSPGGRPGTAC